MTYLILKLLHVVAVILWIGPALGAYIFLFRAHQTKDPEKIRWAEQVTEQVLKLEHVAFFVLIATGLGFLIVSDGAMLALPWLQKKLWLFGGVLMFELFDMYVSHHLTARALHDNAPLDGPAWRRINRLRRPLMLAAAVVGTVLIPGILYFAVGKV